MTSKDFLKSWQRLVDPLTAAEYSSLLDIVKNGIAIRNRKLPPDSLGAIALDDSTFQVELVNPANYFLDLCAFEAFFPVPVDTIALYKEKWTSPEHLVGNGPYVIEAWKRNVEIVLRKNPKYWDSANVRQSTLIIKPVTDQLTAYNMFMNGELDWSLITLPSSKLAAAQKTPEYFARKTYGTYYYIVNCTKPGFDSPDFRRALSYAIDRDKIVQRVMKGVVVPATGLVPPTPDYPGPGYSFYDTAKAKAYLSKAGFGPGRPAPKVEILYNTLETHKDIAEVIRQMWKEVLGLDAELVNYEWKVFLENTKNMNYNAVARSSWFGDFPDPISFLEMHETGNGNNRTGFSNPEYDRLIKESRRTVDSEKRMAILLEAEKLLLDQMPLIPIYYYTLTELRTPKLKGAVPNALGMYTWKDISLSP